MKIRKRLPITYIYRSSLKNNNGESIYDSNDRHLVLVNLKHATKKEYKTLMEIFDDLFLYKECHKGKSAKGIHRKIY